MAMDIDEFPVDPFAPKEKFSQNGTKHDRNKPNPHLLPPVPLLGASRVFGFGADKYGEYNFRGGIKYSRLYSACLRHLLAWWDGVELDQESGESHLDHALCSLMMLRQMTAEHPDLDDRYKHT